MLPSYADSPTIGLARNYREAMTLLTDARDYAAFAARNDAASAEPFARLRVNMAAMKLTACLAGITAWLMAQRAAEVGEIGREETKRGEFRLAQCPLGEAETAEVALPPRLLILIRRALTLHERLQRLDRLLEEPPSSA